MNGFDYEQSIWGQGDAAFSFFSPTYFRLKQALRSLDGLKRGRVLELGCGGGQFIRAIKKMRPELECFGCDISQSAIDKAKLINDGVNYSLCSSKLGFDTQFFDAILVFDVLEHAENLDEVLSDANRVLKSGGIFYCCVPCEGDWLSLWNLLDKFGLKNDLTKKYAGHIHYFSRKSLVELLSKHGFALSKKIYSEHLLGQLVGVASFVAMDKFAKKNNLRQINNEQYFGSLNNKSITWLKRAINALINLESSILFAIPSPNVNFILKKN